MAARMQNGELLCALLDMSLDPLEEPQLAVKGEVKKIRRLMPDGSYEGVSFTKEGELYTLDTRVEPFDPLILIVE